MGRLFVCVGRERFSSSSSSPSRLWLGGWVGGWVGGAYLGPLVTLDAVLVVSTPGLEQGLVGTATAGHYANHLEWVGGWVVE